MGSIVGNDLPAGAPALVYGEIGDKLRKVGRDRDPQRRLRGGTTLVEVNHICLGGLRRTKLLRRTVSDPADAPGILAQRREGPLRIRYSTLSPAQAAEDLLKRLPVHSERPRCRG